MLKQAFRSYLSAIHPRNIKKLKEDGNWFWYIYFLFIYPMLMSSVNDDDFARYIWLTFIKLLPILLMSWSNITSKFLMPKAMFLCPMKPEDRKKYIHCVLLIKIGIPVLLGVVIELIWSVFYEFKFLQIITIAFVHFSIGIATYFCFEGKGKNDRNINFARRDKAGNTRWAWVNILSLIWAVLLLVGFEMVDLTSSMTLGSGIVIGVSVVVLLLCDIWILTHQYEETIEQSGDYELTFRVLSQVKGKTYTALDIFN